MIGLGNLAESRLWVLNDQDYDCRLGYRTFSMSFMSNRGLDAVVFVAECPEQGDMDAQQSICHFSFLGKLPADNLIITAYTGSKRKEDDLKYDRRMDTLEEAKTKLYGVEFRAKETMNLQGRETHHITRQSSKKMSETPNINF